MKRGQVGKSDEASDYRRPLKTLGVIQVNRRMPASLRCRVIGCMKVYSHMSSLRRHEKQAHGQHEEESPP
ncbi:hypothetical protein RUND412_004721 [Rhizina undulata]